MAIKFWQRLRRSLIGSRSTSAMSCHQRLFRPQVERLDERITPADFFVRNLANAGDGSLRKAITDLQDANINNNHRILFEVAANMPLQGVIVLQSALPTITRNVQIIGSGMNSLEIKRDLFAPNFRIFTFNLGQTAAVTLRDMKISQGNADDDFYRNGGAISITGGREVSITNTKIENNIAWQGGGIFITSSFSTATRVLIQDSHLMANTARPAPGAASQQYRGVGGGIFGTGNINLTISNTRVEYNSASAYAGGINLEGANVTARIQAGSQIVDNIAVGDGGGMYINGGTVAISSSVVNGNRANNGHGGGVYISGGGTAAINESTISYNFAELRGAGIYFASSRNGVGLTLSNSTLRNNEANSVGGGVAVMTGTAHITNNTITGNSAFEGGGVFRHNVAEAVVQLNGNTIINNRAQRGNNPDQSVRAAGGGVFLDGAGIALSSLSNNIIAENTADEGSPDVDGAITSLGHNFIGDGTGGSGFATTDLVGTDTNPLDPLLGSLGFHGGPTETFVPLANSPVIDAGANAYATDPTDQRGYVRIVGSAVDIGAVETVPGTSVQGRLWNDRNHDGLQDETESGIANQYVALYSATGSFIASLMTNSAGYYHFTGLAAGDYYVTFAQPSYYWFSPADQGDDDTRDSEANTYGTTAVFTLAAGDSLANIDAGTSNNHAPAANSKWYDVKHDRTLTTTNNSWPSGLLYMDYDSEGDPRTVVAINGISIAGGETLALDSGALLTINSDGTFSYIPPAGYTGTDSFTFTVSDGALTTTATASINVTNQAPSVYDKWFDVKHDHTLSVAAWQGLFSGSWDSDGDTLTLTKINGQSVQLNTPLTLSSGATLTVQADGSFVYTPPANTVLQDSFTFTLSDGIATVSSIVHINVTNQAPSVYDKWFDVKHDRTLSVAAWQGLFSGSWDSDGDTLTLTKINGQSVQLGTELTLASGGKLTVQADGSFVYTPPANTVLQDSFTFTLSDGIGSATSFVRINVTNQAPYVNSDYYNVLHDHTYQNTWSVLSNDYDYDGDTLNITAINGVAFTPGSPIALAQGTLTMSANGLFTYTPAAGQVYDESFTVTVSDGIASATASVQLHVYNNQPTLYTPMSPTVSEGQLVDMMLSAYDPDQPTDTLTFSLEPGAPTGAAINASTGRFTFTPPDNGTYTISVRVTDGLASDVKTFTITANNVAPTATFGFNGTATVGQAITAVFSNQHDPSSVDTAAGFLYSYDFNNDGDFTDADDRADITAEQAQVIFSESGWRTIHGRIKDKDGGATDYWTSVFVSDL